MTIVFDKIPESYIGRFPADYKIGIYGWDFSRHELSENRGKLLTMDIDFGDDCFLSCPHCFRRGGLLDKNRKLDLNYDEIVDVIKQGKELGLKSIKFLGAGEPDQEPRFIEFIEYLKNEDIKSVLFTKGHIVGDDKLAKRYHGHMGINNGYELAEKLMECDVTPMVGFRYLDPEMENRNVGMKGYAEKRDRAIRILTDVGFNKHRPTRMGLTPLPITKENLKDAFEIFKYGKRRNMAVIVTPTMISGLCYKQSYLDSMDISDEQKIELYTDIYKWNIENGIQNIDDIRRDGVSAYAGEVPCNQVACGVYVTLDGTVLRCPGDDITVFGNVRERSLKEIWEGSENFERSGTYNCHCPPKAGKTIPHGFYDAVLERIESGADK